jgi:hypothetical protein
VAFAGDKKKAAVVIFLLPTIDVLTDISYWTTTGFYRPYIFALSILSFFVPNVVFLYKIYEMRIMPYVIKIFPGFLLMGKTKLVWLSASNGRPAINGELLSIKLGGVTYPLTFANHDSVVKAFLYILLWLIVVILQFFYLFSFFVWVVLSLVYLGPLALLGIYLFQCKVISVGPVWNFYFRMWAGSGAEIARRTIDVDTGILNLSLLAHLLNTFPQVILSFFSDHSFEETSSLNFFFHFHYLVFYSDR